MAQYIPFAKGVEVNGQTILSFIKAIPAYENAMLGILANHGLALIDSKKLYPQKSWLDTFKEIGKKYGSNTLFSVVRQYQKV